MVDFPAPDMPVSQNTAGGGPPLAALDPAAANGEADVRSVIDEQSTTKTRPLLPVNFLIGDRLSDPESADRPWLSQRKKLQQHAASECAWSQA